MSQSKGLLRQFVDVKKNEVEPALLFFSLWFLLILVFQILRPLKAGLFIENLGAYWELYAKLTNIGVAVVAMAVFTALYNRLGSLRLLKALCGFFIVALLSFAVALREGTPSPLTNWLFYLFGDAWSTIWVTTFWAYLNEMTKTEQSKRLYGFIGGGGVLGGLVGNLLVWQLVRPFGSSALLVGSAIATGAVGVFVWRTEALARLPGAAIGRQSATSASAATIPDRKQAKANPAVEGAKLVRGSKYLISIVMIMFLYELASQILDYQYKTAAQALEGEAATGPGVSGPDWYDRWRHQRCHAVFPGLVRDSQVRNHDRSAGVAGRHGSRQQLLHRSPRAMDRSVADHLRQLVQLLNQPNGSRNPVRPNVG